MLLYFTFLKYNKDKLNESYIEVLVVLDKSYITETVQCIRYKTFQCFGLKKKSEILLTFLKRIKILTTFFVNIFFTRERNGYPRLLYF